jgi:hypothetical protein
MSSKSVSCGMLFVFALSIIGVPPLQACKHNVLKSHDTSDSGFARQLATVMPGTWSGSFFSNQSNASSGFTMTVVISPDSRGHLLGDSTLSSNCLKRAKLQITSSVSNVVLSGRDEEGNSITIRGTLDNTGSVMQARYILQGSASGGCDMENGIGNLGKR